MKLFIMICNSTLSFDRFNGACITQYVSLPINIESSYLRLKDIISFQELAVPIGQYRFVSQSIVFC